MRSAERRKLNFELKYLRSLIEVSGMDRGVGNEEFPSIVLEERGSWRVDWIREY